MKRSEKVGTVIALCVGALVLMALLNGCATGVENSLKQALANTSTVALAGYKAINKIDELKAQAILDRAQKGGDLVAIDHELSGWRQKRNVALAVLDTADDLLKRTNDTLKKGLKLPNIPALIGELVAAALNIKNTLASLGIGG